jgi:hypothetical protein
MNALSKSNKCLRWTHEYLFLLNLALAIVWIETVDSKYGVGGPVVASYFYKIFRYPISLATHPGFLEMIVWPLILAAVAFPFLRALSRFVAMDVALRTIAGVAAIASFPWAMWTSDGIYFRRDYRIESLYIAISLDAIVLLSCAILYYLRKLPFSVPLMIVILLVHFTIWAWMTERYMDIPSCISDYHQHFHSWGRTFAVCAIRTAFFFEFPVVGFLAGAAWIFYVRRTQVRVGPSFVPKPTVV